MKHVFDLEGWLQPRREALDAWLAPRFLEVWPESFADPLRYPVFGGGKRVRPALVLAAYEAVSGKETYDPALAAAAAVELVHTYSLVHDDLPAMDDDSERRGQPTVHVLFGDAVAILVGDALLTEAFSALADAPVSAEARIAMVSRLARASGHAGMVGGQVADIAGGELDLDALTELHAAKTGALITASCILGGLSAGADPATLRKLETFGQKVGLAFQLADDVLDADEDTEAPSFVRLLGVDATRERAITLADEAIAAVSTLARPQALSALARFTVEREL